MTRRPLITSAVQILADPRLSDEQASVRELQRRAMLGHALTVAVARGWPVSPSLLRTQTRTAA